MTSPAVETHALTKRYGSVTALDGLDLEIAPGCFFGLLGPNGAGKTTAVSILCTLLRPSEGVARVFGHDVVAERRSVRPLLGLVFQEPSLDTELTGRENLEIHARLYHVPERRANIARVLDLMESAADADRPTARLSGGQRRRLEIARALLHQPRVLFLDEPSVGLDVHARRTLWEQLERLRTGGLTLILTTHAMDEAERLCERVAILNAGRIVARGTPRELCASVGGDRIEVEVVRADASITGMLRTNPAVRDVTVEQATLRITVRDAASQLVAILDAVKPLGIRAVRMREVNLEDAFVHFTGRRIDAAGDLE